MKILETILSLSWKWQQIYFTRYKGEHSRTVGNRGLRKPRSPRSVREVFALCLNGKSSLTTKLKELLQDASSWDEDIPAAPKHIYKAQGWQDWGECLRKGTTAKLSKKIPLL